MAFIALQYVKFYNNGVCNHKLMWNLKERYIGRNQNSVLGTDIFNTYINSIDSNEIIFITFNTGCVTFNRFFQIEVCFNNISRFNYADFSIICRLYVNL